jgi:uncharacterized protein YjbI with pentapeptide repeats
MQVLDKNRTGLISIQQVAKDPVLGFFLVPHSILDTNNTKVITNNLVEKFGTAGHRASLHAADFEGADLAGSFDHADLNSANLDGANIESANLNRANLTYAHGLDKVKARSMGAIVEWQNPNGTK